MKLGLVGGVSPFAFAEIYCDICKNYRNLYGEYPQIVVYSVKCSKEDEDDFLCNKEQKSENIINELKSACEFFSKNGVEIVGICCNTLSNIFESVAEEYCFKRILTPVNAVLNNVKNHNDYFVFATRFTCESKLYGENVKYLSNENQLIVDKILSDKIDGKEDVNVNKNLQDIAKENNISNVILGCTDFCANDFMGCNVNILDSSKLFADECIKVLKDVE